MYAGRDGAGKRQYVNRRVVGTRKEAARALTQLLRERDTHTLATGGKQRLDELVETYFGAIAGTVRPRTLAHYRLIYATYLKGPLGAWSLERLMPQAVQRCYSDLTAKGLSPKTVRLVHTILHSALAQAVQWRMLAMNPTQAVKLPRMERREMRCLTPDEVRRFLAVAADDPLAAYWLLLMTTGMRPGEAAGLKWTDLRGDELTVQRSLWRSDKGQWALTEPKTSKSVRTIPLPPEVVRALVKQKAQQAADRLRAGPHWQDHGLIFTTALGGPINLESSGRYRFRTLLRKAGCPQVRLYDCRHSHATALLVANVNVKVVSERLGHASPMLTLQTYQHVLPGMQRAATDTMAALLFPAPEAAKAGG